MRRATLRQTTWMEGTVFERGQLDPALILEDSIFIRSSGSQLKVVVVPSSINCRQNVEVGKRDLAP